MPVRPRSRALAFVLLAAALGCSTTSGTTTDPCPTSSKCSKDRPDPSACRAALADSKCGSKYNEYLTCALTEHERTPCCGDGTTDLASIVKKCETQWNAYLTCSGRTSDAGAQTCSSDAGADGGGD